ncbi:MAG: hypothetical protein IJU96_00250 [Clostridia bacterium]|nr:hypothetical protein [Clostridia bacterium]
MNISLIALNISGAESAQSAADFLKEQLSAYGECDFQLCGAIGQVSAALSRAFAKAEVIAVGVEPAAFAKTKLAVLRAMRIKTELNPAIAERLKTRPDLDGQRVAMHAAVPVGAAVFPSESGFCSGFATRSGNQVFLMLPLDKAVAEGMMQNGVEPYFGENGIEKEAGAKPQAPVDLPQALTLREMNKKVYFATAPALVHFRELYGSGNEDVFVFDSYAKERNGESPKSYLADLSRDAIPQDERNAFGAAISNVFTGVSQSGEQRYNVYIALSDGASSRVIRFLSQPEETPDELIEAAYEMLLDMIAEKCRDELSRDEDDETSPEETPEIVEEETPAQHKKRRQNAVTAIVFTLLAVLIALAVLLFFRGADNAKNNSAEAKRALASNAAQREEEETDDLSWFGALMEEESSEEATTIEE